MSELKSILSDDHLMKQREVKLFGTYHYVHSQMAELVVSQLASQPTQDLLKIPSPTELDKIPKNSNIIEEVNILQLVVFYILYYLYSILCCSILTF